MFMLMKERVTVLLLIDAFLIVLDTSGALRLRAITDIRQHEQVLVGFGLLSKKNTDYHQTHPVKYQSISKYFHFEAFIVKCQTVGRPVSCTQVVP